MRCNAGFVASQRPRLEVVHRSAPAASPRLRAVPSFVAEDLLSEADAVLPDVIDLRRRLHRHPELGLELPRTQQAVLDALDGCNVEVLEGNAVTSVVADLHGDASDGQRVVLLRSDMDALPMPEDTGLEQRGELAFIAGNDCAP